MAARGLSQCRGREPRWLARVAGSCQPHAREASGSDPAAQWRRIPEDVRRGRQEVGPGPVVGALVAALRTVGDLDPAWPVYAAGLALLALTGRQLLRA